MDFAGVETARHGGQSRRRLISYVFQAPFQSDKVTDRRMGLPIAERLVESFDVHAATLSRHPCVIEDRQCRKFDKSRSAIPQGRLQRRVSLSSSKVRVKFHKWHADCWD